MNQWEWPIVVTTCVIFSWLLTSWIFRQDRRKREKRILQRRLQELK